MDLTHIAQSFVTLFVVIDPVAATPIFMAMTAGLPAAQRRAAALRATGVAFGVLLVFGLAGERLLQLSGISLSAFRISGGILLFLIAAEMLFERRTARRSQQAGEVEDDPAVFPIGIPLIAGPGAMATMVLLASQHHGAAGQMILHLVMAAVIAVTLALFLAAGVLTRAMSHTSINVMTRLFGILLAALAVQIVLDGIAGLHLPGAAG